MLKSGQIIGYLSDDLSADKFNPKNIARMNCNETLFDIITAIEAYDFSGMSSVRTMNVHTKFVFENEIGLDISTKLSVPMKAKSCSPNENESLGLPGESYEVTVNWQVRQVDNITYTALESLKNNPKHLILRTYNGKGFFIRCEENGYKFSYSEKNGELDCELSIYNKNGIQRIL